MPKRSARDLACINNFGHHKKLHTLQHADKENVSLPQALATHIPSQGICCPPLQPSIHLNSFGIHLEVSSSVICKYSIIILGVSSTKAEYLAQPHAHALKPFIEEVEDEDCSPELYPLPFESKGPIMIEVFPDHFFTEPYAEVEIFGDLDEDRSESSKVCNNEDDKDTDEDEESDSDEDSDGPESDEDETQCDISWELRKPPSLEAAQNALADINRMLKPPRLNGKGIKECQLPLLLWTRLEWIASFLHVYTHPGSGFGTGSYGSRWMASSLHCAHAQQSTTTRAKNLRKWAKALINDWSALPISTNGDSRNSRIDDDNVATDIATHLQSLGPYIRALDIVQYTSIPAVKEHLRLKKTISLATAQRWMKKPSGQYVDGHEQADIVYYRQSIFLPAWAELDHRIRLWTTDNQEIANEALAAGRVLVVWFHDECTFYANDRQIVCWVHESEKAVPQTKGEGASLMVADFISADYGWLMSADGTQSTQVLFKAGKQREGYFTNADILNHTRTAMDVLDKDYKDEDHVLVFDNATTHLK